MTNEYLLAKDLKLRLDRKKSGLESSIEENISPVLFEQSLLHSPEMQAHATTCTNFGIQSVHIGGEEITLEPSDFEKQIVSAKTDFKEMNSKNETPAGQIYEPPQGRLNNLSPNQSRDGLKQDFRFDGQEYSTGKSIPLTCNCGETLQVTFGGVENISYKREVDMGGGDKNNVPYGSKGLPSASEKKPSPYSM